MSESALKINPKVEVDLDQIIAIDARKVTLWKRDTEAIIKMLKERKAELPYGQWGKYLEGIKLPRKTAYRLLNPVKELLGSNDPTPPHPKAPILRTWASDEKPEVIPRQEEEEPPEPLEVAAKIQVQISGEYHLEEIADQLFNQLGYHDSLGLAFALNRKLQ